MVTDKGDGWKLFEGQAKYVKPCLICGQNVYTNPVYRGASTMHEKCFADWHLQGRPTLATPTPPANAPRTLANASPSDSAALAVSNPQPQPQDALLRCLEQIGAEISEVHRAVREQTAFLASNSGKTEEVK